MATVIKVSDASSLAVHAAVLLAEAGERPVSVVEMASFLRASEAHLAKVMQRLTKASLVQSTRGPHGGFTLARPAIQITLLDVYEAIEGELKASSCLLGRPVCAEQSCLLGGFLHSLNEQVRDYLGSTAISTMASAGAGRLPVASAAR